MALGKNVILTSRRRRRLEGLSALIQPKSGQHRRTIYTRVGSAVRDRRVRAVRRDDEARERLDPGETIANLFDPWHIFGKDAQCRALAVIGHGATQFDDATLDTHIDA